MLVLCSGPLDDFFDAIGCFFCSTSSGQEWQWPCRRAGRRPLLSVSGIASGATAPIPYLVTSPNENESPPVSPPPPDSTHGLWTLRCHGRPGPAGGALPHRGQAPKSAVIMQPSLVIFINKQRRDDPAGTLMSPGVQLISRRRRVP